MTPRFSVIVNADDFGMSVPVNRAIAHCFARELISSATLLANFECFEEACETARNQKFADRLGLHINLTEGRPLCPALSANSRLCDADGNFRPHRGRFLSAQDSEQISEEVTAQVARCRKHGISLTHADSHQHVHNEPLVFPAVRRALRAANVPFLRITRNLFPTDSRSLPKRLSKWMYNKAIELSGLRGTEFFGSVDDFERQKHTPGWDRCSYEILTHPTFDQNGSLFDHVEHCLLEQKLERVFQGLRKQSYRDIAEISAKQPKLSGGCS
jgi:predicted glycoside hydrolase/deacetylase ChbG (UPF0249 family)